MSLTQKSEDVSDVLLSSDSAAGDKMVSNDAEDNVKVDVTTSPPLWKFSQCFWISSYFSCYFVAPLGFWASHIIRGTSEHYCVILNFCSSSFFKVPWACGTSTAASLLDQKFSSHTEQITQPPSPESRHLPFKHQQG